MGKAARVNTTITEMVDMSSGAILSRKADIVEEGKTVSEPQYIKLYINDLCLLANVPDAQKSLLILLLKELSYENYIQLSTRIRKRLCDELGIKSGTLRNRLNLLVKTKLLVHTGQNEYLANPEMFARGKWVDIVKNKLKFEMVVKYGPTGERTIETKPLLTAVPK